ncbi:MAG: protein-L-isoaspartate(D-aspartate) O-methyltransferase [Leptospiraceae bacterium]|nr:protein-L-isoaspartate(D-aspartate) O-methyltransferase [Leptospiraceae bacterium]
MILEKKAMLELLKDRGISNPKVLKAMEKVPRENFVLERYKSEAYEDGPLPIGNGQTISQPYIVAYMTQELELTGKEKVLEIGFGSGYQTAILAELAKEVYSIEILPDVFEFGKSNLSKMGYKNIFLKLGDGRTGWKNKAPFDCILAAAAPESLPEELVSQLKEGGRMVIPIGELQNQILYTYVKREGKLIIRNRLPVRFVPMTK